ncbi:putative epimerase [Dactylonectria macrodidyma]|uniref:Epimerase n=1 Tax=Dactylonectria macrodidyma TaxID=307937 RepID=A0A9P9I8S8_9HYPO|nr:putative epimerase [Dactylonectria macrodidyma]
MVTELDFVTLDVFTATPFKGNPLGVVHLPPPSKGAALSQAQKQAIAREFNLSETVFIHDVDSDDEQDTHTRVIDIFITTREIPFAGHPTIGTAAYLSAKNVSKLITKAGPIPIRLGPEDGVVSATIPYNTHLNTKVLGDLESSLSSSLLHLTPEIKSAELGAPLFSIVNGMTFALIRLSSLELLSRVSPGRFPIAAQHIMDPEWSETFLGRYYNVLIETSVSKVGVRTVKLRTRLVEDVIEDPATGSAACALSTYLALHEYEETRIRFDITQGVEMGRQSGIAVDVEVDIGEEGARRIQEVRLGGKARQIMRGTIVVPPVS